MMSVDVESTTIDLGEGVQLATVFTRSSDARCQQPEEVGPRSPSGEGKLRQTKVGCSRSSTTGARGVYCGQIRLVPGSWR